MYNDSNKQVDNLKTKETEKKNLELLKTTLSPVRIKSISH